MFVYVCVCVCGCEGRVYVCVCVCVCERERERGGREGEMLAPWYCHEMACVIVKWHHMTGYFTMQSNTT